MTHDSKGLRGHVAGDVVATGDQHGERCAVSREAIDPKLEFSREQLRRWLNDAAIEAIESPPAANLDVAVGQLLHAARKEGAIELGSAVMMLQSLHRSGADGLAFRALFRLAAELFAEDHTKLILERHQVIPEAEIEELRREWMRILP